jgi:hypothetical protein
MTKMTKQDQEDWMKIVDESRIEYFIILDQISKGFVQEEDLDKLRRFVNPFFDLITIVGPETWNKVLDLSMQKKEEEKLEIIKDAQ